MAPEHQHVWLDGRRYELLPIEHLEAFAEASSARVEYPVTINDWALVNAPTGRYAAWWPGQRAAS